MYRWLIRPIFFSMDPEKAHHLALFFLRVASKWRPLCWFLGKILGYRHFELRQEIWGIDFPSPVGLAAGFDKEASALTALGHMGFGFIEVGAISSEERPGNPGPRIFRLKADRALINRMGLPNPGAEKAAQRLAALKDRPVPILANIVKNADLDGDVPTMAADYLKTLAAIYPYVEGFTVNISCPATPNLKAFNAKDAMFELMGLLKAERDKLAAAVGGLAKPLIVKVSPDVDEAEKTVLLQACQEGLADGLVLTNTTRQRPVTLKTGAEVLAESGGLSGAPLYPIALALVKDFAAATKGKVPIIAVGGISSVAQAKEMLDAGASLVEIYTAYVYEGPAFPKFLTRGLFDLGWRPRQ